MAKPQYATKHHRDTVATYRRLVDEGKGWCCEVVCLIEQAGGSRWIPPRSPMHAAHDRSDPSGMSYLGPAHAKCNSSEGAAFGNRARGKNAAPSGPLRRRRL